MDRVARGRRGEGEGVCETRLLGKILDETRANILDKTNCENTRVNERLGSVGSFDAPPPPRSQ